MQYFLQSLPNLLTALRFVLALALPWSPVEWRFSMLLVAGFSDLIDGPLSRLSGSTSRLGQFFDPIADKTLVVAAAATALSAGWITWLELLALASRDLAVVALSCWALWLNRENWKRLTPRLSGKIAMAAQTAVLLLLFWRCAPQTAWVWAAAVFSLLAAMDYSLHAWRKAQAE